MNNKAFTLIEMLIVLMIISILIIITIPNVTKHNQMINEKGCEAYIKMVQTQIEAYEIETDLTPTLSDLETAGYIDSTACPNGSQIEIDSEGNVILSENSAS